MSWSNYAERPRPELDKPKAGTSQFGGLTTSRARSCLTCGKFKDPLGGKGTGVRWMCAGCLAAKKEASNG